MGIEYGFFDSVNHDRLYNSKNFSDYFEGLIEDGVYGYVGDALKVSTENSMNVRIGTGRAKVLNRYVKNTDILTLDISSADVSYPRIDAVVVGVNVNERIGEIKMIQGIPSVNPMKPEIPSDENAKYFPLAYVRVDANSTVISSANIQDMRGTTECPWVVGILKQIDLTGFSDQYRDMIDKFEKETAPIIDRIQDIKNVMDALENFGYDPEKIKKLQEDVDAISYTLSSGTIAQMVLEVTAARTSSISGETYSSLSERLEADFANLKKCMRIVDIISSYIELQVEVCGENTEAVLYGNDTMKVTGDGSIAERAFEKREDFGALEINIGGDVGMGAFGGCENVNTISVECQRICDNAFWACPKLNSLTIGKTVKEIGSGIISNSAFYIPSGVRVMYAGTIAEWKAITKADNWIGGNVTIENNCIICSDGNAEV